MKRPDAQLSHIQPLQGCKTEDGLSPRLRLGFLISRLFEADMEIQEKGLLLDCKSPFSFLQQSNFQKITLLLLSLLPLHSWVGVLPPELLPPGLPLP